MKFIFLLTLNLFLFGCASTTATLTIDSQPQGAYIAGNSVASGSRINLPFGVLIKADEFEKNKDANGCYFFSAKTSAVWMSGATTTTDGFKLCGSSRGSYKYIFYRDMSLPGLEMDLDFEMKRNASIALQQQIYNANQAQLNQQQADWAREQQRSLERQLKPQQPQPQPQLIYKDETRCTTSYSPLFKEYTTVCR
jgi:hypothetical protein